MSGGWSVNSARPGIVHAAVPVVPISRPCIRIEALHFATSASGSTDWQFLYQNGNTHALLPRRSLRWWGKGVKIVDPEWERSRPEANNLRACFIRKQPVVFRVKLVCNTSVALSGSFTATPKLDRSTTDLTPVTISFTYPPGAPEHWVTINLGGQMPDEVGRYILRFRWQVIGSGFRFCGPTRSRLRIYGIYAAPLDPAHDSSSTADVGRILTRAEGTLTGTKKRLDHMMLLIGGSNRRHSVSTVSDLVDLYWRLHMGINNTPGAPPYFDAEHNEHLTIDGSSGTEIPLEDQWLAWVRDSSNWNDASCIGHVQIAKTMLASVGLFARRTWVFPHTNKLPNRTTIVLADTDIFSLGNHDSSKKQTWTFTVGGLSLLATAVLMENPPGISWENFEACMLSPNGKLLTGGYNTRSNPASFRSNKGFNSAAELLQWWSNTRRGSFRRFMCWMYFNEATGEIHFWDVDGNRYDESNWEDIRRNGKQLPPPL